MTCALYYVVCMVYDVRAWYVRGYGLRDVCVCDVLMCEVRDMGGVCCVTYVMV